MAAGVAGTNAATFSLLVALLHIHQHAHQSKHGLPPGDLGFFRFVPFVEADLRICRYEGRFPASPIPSQYGTPTLKRGEHAASVKAHANLKLCKLWTLDRIPVLWVKGIEPFGRSNIIEASAPVGCVLPVVRGGSRLYDRMRYSTNSRANETHP